MSEATHFIGALEAAFHVDFQVGQALYRTPALPTVSSKHTKHGGVCECMCVCAYVSACVCMCVCTECMHARVCIHEYVCVPVCVCVCLLSFQELALPV